LHIREFLTAFIAAIVPAVLNIQGLDMSNILIVNGAKTFAHSNGELNDTLTDLAASVLADLGHQVKISRADSNYDAKDEVQNFLWADAVIYQMPGWWMGITL
jgi:modulator of drug activity B